MADLVILSGDIEATEPGDVDTLKVALTVCDGQITYERAAS